MSRAAIDKLVKGGAIATVVLFAISAILGSAVLAAIGCGVFLIWSPLIALDVKESAVDFLPDGRSRPNAVKWMRVAFGIGFVVFAAAGILVLLGT